MKDFDAKLREYARLLVEVGVNLQKGQTLTLVCPVDCAFFGRLCAEYAYEAGARQVIMDWRDDTMTRLKYLKADSAVFDEVEPWIKPMFDHFVEIEAPRLVILGDDPEALAGVDSDRIRRAKQSRYPAVRDYSDAQMASKFQWSIGACAVPVWAKKVFPDLPEDQAMEALWDKIFAAVRVTGDGGAVQAWRDHVAGQKERISVLNGLKLVSLHYENGLGTDLTVGLPEGHFWSGGAELSGGGVEFVANMPTEEIFTLPHRDRVNGRVYAAMPLVLDGNLVEGFWMEFKDGKMTDLHADKGEAYLRDSMALDEGASYLGEVALVPYHSPIRDTGILFYETLFDENAACHFAYGEAYPCLEGAEGKSKDELRAMGANDSLTHVDFMVGTADLNITGLTADGREVPIFRNGDFVI